MSTTTPDAPATPEAPKPAPPPAANRSTEAAEPEVAVLPEDHPLVKALAAQKDEIKALKDKARRLDALEDAQKSEAERAADALTKAKAEAEQNRAELLRYRTAATHGITDPEDIELFLTGRDEETLIRQAKALAARNAANAAPRPPRPNPAQREGDSPVEDKDAVARAFFGINK